MSPFVRIFFLAVVAASLSCAAPRCPPGPAEHREPTAEVTKPREHAPASAGAAREAPSANDDGRTMLREGWRLVSSAKVKDRGEAIATTGYRDAGWYPPRVPP